MHQFDRGRTIKLSSGLVQRYKYSGRSADNQVQCKMTVIRVTKCRAITPVTITQITVGRVLSPGQNLMKYNCSDSKFDCRI